jgi:hypothetical protein
MSNALLRRMDKIERILAATQREPQSSDLARRLISTPHVMSEAEATTAEHRENKL